MRKNKGILIIVIFILAVGASAIECGHYENLSLEAARMEAKLYLEVLEAQINMEFTYPEA